MNGLMTLQDAEQCRDQAIHAVRQDLTDGKLTLWEAEQRVDQILDHYNVAKVVTPDAQG